MSLPWWSVAGVRRSSVRVPRKWLVFRLGYLTGVTFLRSDDGAQARNLVAGILGLSIAKILAQEVILMAGLRNSAWRLVAYSSSESRNQSPA